MKNEELVRTLSETAASKTIVTRIASSRMNGFTRLVNSLAIASLLLACVALHAQTSPPLSGDQIIERASPAVVLILAGSGDGKVTAIGSGLIVRPDGIVLTASHVVKGMKEVQIRLKNGEVYDRVETITADERR